MLIQSLIRPCEICKEDYRAKSMNQRYCSDECRQIANPRTKRKCMICDLEFEVTLNNQRKCLSCIEAYKESRKALQAFFAEKPKHTLCLVTCPNCNSVVSACKCRLDKSTL